MRLIIDGRRLTQERTGVGRVLESLLQEWAIRGLPLEPATLVLKDPAGLKRVPRIAGLEVVQIGERWPGLWWEPFGLGRFLRASDLLFAPANLIPIHWRGRTVLTIFDLVQEILPESFPWHIRWRFGWRYRLAAQRATVVVVPSRSTAQDVVRVFGVSPERVRIVALAPEHAFQPLPSDSDLVLAARRTIGLRDEPFFLFVGKRSRRRNVPAILDAFHAYRARDPDHHLVFAGPTARASDGVETDRNRGIIVAGHVPEPVLQGLLAAATALLYPSNYEGFGLPVVEAMACGCPVISLRNSALVEVGGDAARYARSAHASDLLEAMEAISDPAERARRIELGLRQAERFSRSAFAAGMTAAIQEVAAMALPATRASLRVRASAFSESQ